LNDESLVKQVCRAYGITQIELSKKIIFRKGHYLDGFPHQKCLERAEFSSKDDA